MRVDKNALLAEANCIDVANYIGMNVVRKGANNFILCPGHEKRLGKKDNKIGNCVLYPDGYVCYACDPHKKHNAIDMVMEFLDCSFLDAVSTIAEIYGGVESFENNTPEERLALSPEDLKLIGLKASGKLFLPENGSYAHFEPVEGCYLEKVDNEYLSVKTPSSFSLLNLKKESEKEFCFLIREKAKEAGLRYQNAYKNFARKGRLSPEASTVFDLFQENGAVSDSTFTGIQNALKAKMFRCKEIYDMFEPPKE